MKGATAKPSAETKATARVLTQRAPSRFLEGTEKVRSETFTAETLRTQRKTKAEVRAKAGAGARAGARSRPRPMVAAGVDVELGAGGIPCWRLGTI